MVFIVVIYFLLIHHLPHYPLSHSPWPFLLVLLPLHTPLCPFSTYNIYSSLLLYLSTFTTPMYEHTYIQANEFKFVCMWKKAHPCHSESAAFSMTYLPSVPSTFLQMISFFFMVKFCFIFHYFIYLNCIVHMYSIFDYFHWEGIERRTVKEFDVSFYPVGPMAHTQTIRLGS